MNEILTVHIQSPTGPSGRPADALRLTRRVLKPKTTTMARTTVKIDIPDGSPDDLITLIKKVLAEHARREKEKAESSEIPAATVEKLEDLLAKAEPKRAEAVRLAAESQALNQQAYTILGLAEGQNTRTPNTALNVLTGLRDTLQGQHLGSEQALEPYGFNVVIGTASSPKSKVPTG